MLTATSLIVRDTTSTGLVDSIRKSIDAYKKTVDVLEKAKKASNVSVVNTSSAVLTCNATNLKKNS